MGVELTRPVQARRESGLGSSFRISVHPLGDLYAHQQGHRSRLDSLTGPPENGPGLPFQMGLREDGTIRPSVADRRLRGGLPSIGLARSRLSGGRQSTKGYPSSGGVFGSSPSRYHLGPAPSRRRRKVTIFC
jgi:hypothetical protein